MNPWMEQWSKEDAQLINEHADDNLASIDWATESSPLTFREATWEFLQCANSYCYKLAVEHTELKTRCSTLEKELKELRRELNAIYRERGWVYVVGSHEEGRYKIGMTRRQPRKRLAEFTPKLPFEAELICAIKSDDPYSDEAAYHEEFQNQRENGEWFRLSEDNLRWLKLHARLSGGIINEH